MWGAMTWSELSLERGYLNTYMHMHCVRDENVEKFQLSSEVVNQTAEKISAHCFDILRMLGKGGYGKVRGRPKWAWLNELFLGVSSEEENRC